MDMLLLAIAPPVCNVLGETMAYSYGFYPASAMVFRQATLMLPFRSMSNTYFGMTPKVFGFAPKSVFDFD
jgi:hypothetical protein